MGFTCLISDLDNWATSLCTAWKNGRFLGFPFANWRSLKFQSNLTQIWKYSFFNFITSRFVAAASLLPASTAFEGCLIAWSWASLFSVKIWFDLVSKVVFSPRFDLTLIMEKLRSALNLLAAIRSTLLLWPRGRKFQFSSNRRVLHFFKIFLLIVNFIKNLNELLLTWEFFEI